MGVVLSQTSEDRVLGKKKLNVTDPRPPPPRAERLRLPMGSLVRIVIFASLAVMASGWAIWRHYTVPLSPMLVPKTAAPAPSGSEIEVEP
jgi:hypothetical protein